MRTTKEIQQEITREEYEKYRSIDSVDKMRRQIRSDHVPHDLWKDWYGCRMLQEEGHYYLYHRVSIYVELNT